MSLQTLEFQTGLIKDPIDPASAEALLAELPGWEIVSESQTSLTATFKFKDFVAAIAFANRVGELAEQYDHHPALLVEYGRVRVSWWTHTAGGVAANDFVLARETTKLAA